MEILSTGTAHNVNTSTMIEIKTCVWYVEEMEDPRI